MMFRCRETLTGKGNTQEKLATQANKHKPGRQEGSLILKSPRLTLPPGLSTVCIAGTSGDMSGLPPFTHRLNPPF